MLITSDEIKKLLPHRYPVLMIDKVIDYKKYEYIITKKNISVNDTIFNGHFPNYSIYPGVLLLESIAQSGGILGMKSLTINDELTFLLVGVDKAKFKKPAVPSDVLTIETKVLSIKKNFWHMLGTIICDEDKKLVASAHVSCVYIKK